MAQIQTVSDLVKQIKTAIQQSQQPLENSGLKIAKVDMEINTILTGTGEAGARFKVIPVDISGSYEQSQVQKISLSMIPGPPAGVKLFATVKDDLKSAIELINKTVQEASISNPVFNINEAAVELKIGVTKEGSVKVIVGAKAKKTTTHSIKLTLCSKDKS